MKTLTLPQAISPSIHAINSQHHERDIKFPKGSLYAVVLANYYGGKGYTTHKSKEAAAKAAHKLDKEEYSYTIIDDEGNKYFKDYDSFGDVTLTKSLDEPVECKISSLKRFKCTWDRNGISTDFIFLANDAYDALYKLTERCTTIGFTKVNQYDADTRGKLWQDLEDSNTGGNIYIRLDD